jgi:hypothetical protein
MEIANSWADGEDNVRKPRQRSDDEDDDQPKHDLGGRRDRHKKRKKRSYDDSNLVAAVLELTLLISYLSCLRFMHLVVSYC